MLPDHEIRAMVEAGRLGVAPAPAEAQYQPASLDVRLGDTIRLYAPPARPVRLDAIPPDLTVEQSIADGWVIEPGAAALAVTLEVLRLPADVCGLLHGRSTLGRLGIQVHTTAGLIDPGFEGAVTLEVSNLGPLDVELYPGDVIGQITFHPMTSPAARPYGAATLGSHYQGQRGPTAPRTSVPAPVAYLPSRRLAPAARRAAP